MSQHRASQTITVSTSAIQLLPANSARTGLLIQEVGGTNDFTFATAESSVADGFGTHVKAGETIALEGGMCFTGAVWAIRTSTGDASAVASEIVG